MRFKYALSMVIMQESKSYFTLNGTLFIVSHSTFPFAQFCGNIFAVISVIIIIYIYNVYIYPYDLINRKDIIVDII